MPPSPRVAWVCGLCALFCLPGGCKRNPSPAPSATGSTGAPAASAPPAAEPSRCRRLSTYGLTLEAPPAKTPPAPSPSGEPADEDEDEQLLPFGVDVGQAVPTAYGFAVAGLRGAGQAFVAVLGESASRTVELGVLHGDAETPALAAAAERVVVAVRTTDAAGFALKLGQLPGAKGAIEWGYEHTKLGKEVTGLTLALSGESGLVAYQGEDRRGPRLFLGSFRISQLKEPYELQMLEPKDAESPRLSPRPGGFWLAWVRILEDKKPGKVEDGAPSDPEERDLLEVGLRVIEVAKLDERGKPQGAPVRVGEPRRQVLLFDAAAAASGSLLIAQRSDSSAPGAEGGSMILSEISADGSVHEERLEDEEIGAGAPVLLVDNNAPVPEPWLSVSSPSDATRLGRARGQRTLLVQDPLLGRAEVIATRAGHFLTQRARGRGAELSALSCTFEAPAVLPVK